nr:rhomboid family intramembrane serine protease [Lachnospiraceae bacterium]
MKSRLKITFNAPVTLGFVFLCFLVTFLGVSSGGETTRNYFMVYRSPWNSPFTYLRLFTHVLGHSGWEHFIGNAAYLLLLGPVIEEKHGSKILIHVIIITAVVTGLINIIFFPGVALCGASG